MKLFLMLLLFLLLFNCSTSKQKSITDVFEGTPINKDRQVRFTSHVDIFENVYPPAKFVCIERLKLDGISQCIKYLTWDEYYWNQYKDNYQIDRMEYDYDNKVMEIYYRVKELQ